jgi:hypothetical protein
MQPITSAGFREPRAAGRAELAKGMIFRILLDPESKHHAMRTIEKLAAFLCEVRAQQKRDYRLV